MRHPTDSRQIDPDAQLAGYGLWLETQPLAVSTRRAYRGLLGVAQQSEAMKSERARQSGSPRA